MADPITAAAESLWVSGPLRIQRRFPGTRGIVGDWHGVALFPPLAIVAPVVVAVGFFIAGLFGLGYDAVYSESLLLMGVLIGLGSFSSQLGLIGLTSFAAAEFFFSNRQWRFGRRGDFEFEALVRARVPMIITYLLLAVAVIAIPRVGKNMTLAVGRWRRIPSNAAWLIATPLMLVVSWIGIRTWAALAPTLIRPRFTWTGGSPTLEAIQVFQEQGARLISIAVAATLARQLVVGISIYSSTLAGRLKALEARAHLRLWAGDEVPEIDAPAPPTRGRLVQRDLASALAASLVLAGILETRRLWLMVFAVFLVVRLLRSGALPFAPLEAWKQQAIRIPLVVRLGVAWLAAALARNALSDSVIGSYRGMAIFVTIGVVITFAIFPGEPENRLPPKPDKPSEPPEPTTPSSTVEVF